MSNTRPPTPEERARAISYCDCRLPEALPIDEHEDDCHLRVVAVALRAAHAAGLREAAEIAGMQSDVEWSCVEDAKDEDDELAFEHAAMAAERVEKACLRRAEAIEGTPREEP